MNCSSCESELSDAATFCSKCGSPIGREAFSYLPSGTPPWPSTTPQHFSATTAIPLVAPVSAAHRSKIRPLLITTVVLICTLVLGVVGTITTLYVHGQFPPHIASQAAGTTSTLLAATPTIQTTQLPIPTSFLKISFAELNMSFKYPSNWTTDTPKKASDSTSIYTSVHPKQANNDIGTMIIRRFTDATSATIQSPDEVNQAFLTGIRAWNVQDIRVVTPPTSQPMIGGIKWGEQDATYVDGNNGNKIHLATITVQHNKTYYNILIFTSDIYYSEATQKYIQPMLDSLRFIA